MRKVDQDQSGYALAWTLALLMLVTLVQGCTYFGLPQARTFEERLAVGYASVTTVRETTLTLLQSSAITAEDAANVQEQADNARAALDVARGLKGIDLTAAEERLNSTLLILQALQTYLEGRQK